MQDEEFMHHGVKGQKWGILRYQNKDGSYTPLGLARLREKDGKKKKTKWKLQIRSPVVRVQDGSSSTSKPKQQQEQQKKEPPKPQPQQQEKPKIRTQVPNSTVPFTDEELQRAINRIKMEQEFARLTAPPVSRGKKMVTDALYKAGEQVLTDVAKSTFKSVTDTLQKNYQKNNKKK